MLENETIIRTIYTNYIRRISFVLYIFKVGETNFLAWLKMWHLSIVRVIIERKEFMEVSGNNLYTYTGQLADGRICGNVYLEGVMTANRARIHLGSSATHNLLLITYWSVGNLVRCFVIIKFVCLNFLSRLITLSKSTSKEIYHTN